MDHIVILKTSNNVDDGVDLADVGQKFVAQPFTLTGSLHQAGDIDELHTCGDGFGAVTQIREPLQPGIRNRHGSDIRLDGAEREIGSLGLSIGHQGVEESGLAHIGQTDDSGFEHGGKSIGRGVLRTIPQNTVGPLTGENDYEDC
ncbi:MAG: Uncharacterised protein [Cyanobium sp. ARS6]|nr:MAG: Uncharacterised protein [Cyanobium sp. ARS6]